MISEQQQSGKSVAVFCRERDLRVWQFYEWKKRLREAETAQFVELEVEPAAKATRSEAMHSRAEKALGEGEESL